MNDIVSLAAFFWMSRNGKRDIQKTAARETRNDSVKHNWLYGQNNTMLVHHAFYDTSLTFTARLRQETS